MLDEVNKNRPGIHSELILLFLGSPDTFPQNLRNRFDFTTASGILADNHLDCSVFEEMLLALKTGGVCTFATRTEYLTSYGYQAYMDKLEKEGRWKKLNSSVFGRYDKLGDDSTGRFKPTEAQCFAYQKLKWSVSFTSFNRNIYFISINYWKQTYNDKKIKYIDKVHSKFIHLI